MRYFKTILFILTIALVVGVISLRPGGKLATTEVGHLLVLLVPMDSIRVEAGPGLAADKIDIFWFGMTNRPESLQVIRHGTPDQAFPSVHGKNRFVVHYDGKALPGSFVQTKFANWHYHSYRFQVSRNENGELVASASAIGPENEMVLEETTQ